ncbi:hypothetical protein [Nocardia farcinica]|uniref:hypothetical protein n=1 Tax=Nocardia farcinica TaxID=37329 RepID=UPI0003229D5D|nr:hypothetical protein [Nocardia farcinica]
MLVANDIGDDEQGQHVRRRLEERGVERTFAIRSEVVTPRIVVAADDDHTRTWFAHLPGVVSSLGRADLSPIASASFLYLDCYQLIERAVLRVIEAGRAAEVPMLLNLGGSELSQAVEVRHTHCAGAALSAGLLYGLRSGWPMHRGMLLGSASVALRCVRHQSAPLPSMDE